MIQRAMLLITLLLCFCGQAHGELTTQQLRDNELIEKRAQQLRAEGDAHMRTAMILMILSGCLLTVGIIATVIHFRGAKKNKQPQIPPSSPTN